MTTALTLLSLGCILAYTLSVCIKFKGIPNSISASFYSLEHKYWFRFTMWVAPFLLLPTILEVSKTNTEFLAFLAIVGMIIVGCFPDYANDKFARRGHQAGAIMTMVFSQIWVAFNCSWFLLFWLAYITYTIIGICKADYYLLKERFYATKPLFWVEVTCIEIVFLTMFVLL